MPQSEHVTSAPGGSSSQEDTNQPCRVTATLTFTVDVPGLEAGPNATVRAAELLERQVADVVRASDASLRGRITEVVAVQGGGDRSVWSEEPPSSAQFSIHDGVWATDGRAAYRGDVRPRAAVRWQPEGSPVVDAVRRVLHRRISETGGWMLFPARLDAEHRRYELASNGGFTVWLDADLAPSVITGETVLRTERKGAPVEFWQTRPNGTCLLVALVAAGNGTLVSGVS